MATNSIVLPGVKSLAMSELAAEDVRFQYASDQSLLIYFGEKITVEANDRVRRLLQFLDLEPILGVRNLHPAYCSLLVKFDPVKLHHGQLEIILQEYLKRLDQVELPEPRQVEIPVCYGGEFGPDLDEVAVMRGITPAQIVEAHVSIAYRVYFLGFVPGFAYLGELPEILITPRLEVPRRSVPVGSVGIAGSQTGVYPFATPGGWRLLGRTPLQMFQGNSSSCGEGAQNQKPSPHRPKRTRHGNSSIGAKKLTSSSAAHSFSVLSIGDRVRFVPISREQFATLVQI